MAHIDINLDAVESTGGGLHAAGLVHVRVHKATLKDNKDGDGKHILWQLIPLEDENKGHMFLRTSLKPEAQWNLKEFLIACGFGAPDSQKAKRWQANGSFDTDEALGCEPWITNKPEEYNGEMRDSCGPPYKAGS